MTAWMSLVKKTHRAHPGMSYSDAMKMAKKHYKKRGGGEEDDEEVKDVKDEGTVLGARRKRVGGSDAPGPIASALSAATGTPLPPSTGARRRTKRRGGGLSPSPIGGRRRKTRKWRLF